MPANFTTACSATWMHVFFILCRAQAKPDTRTLFSHSARFSSLALYGLPFEPKEMFGDLLRARIFDACVAMRSRVSFLLRAISAVFDYERRHPSTNVYFHEKLQYGIN
jgi:hypothetical protein